MTADTRKQILFVDDEPAILDGLRRVLRPQRGRWEMTFAGPKEAIEHVDNEHFDMVVSDMGMPGCDGATLLSHVRDLVPDALRLVLSGHTDPEASLRAIPVAHQFLPKPFDAELLTELIDRAFALHDVLDSEELRTRIGALESLPSAPAIYTELTAALADPEVDLDSVTGIVLRDPAVCARILQLVNSSFVGLAREISDIRQAVSFVGLDMLRRIALTVEVFGRLECADLPDGFSFETERDHAMLTAAIAGDLLDDKEQSQNAFTAGLLHDFGRWILAASHADAFRKVELLATRSPRPRRDLERMVLGASHAEIGAYVLGSWGLPYSIVEAVAHHHSPSRSGAQRFDPVGAVHVADHLARELVAGEWPVPELDAAFVEASGIDDQIRPWRERAEKVAASLRCDQA